MKRFSWTLAAAVLLIAMIPRVRAAENLIANGEMEGAASAQNLPTHWQPLIVSTPAEFATDFEQKHGGQSSIRIVAPESTRSYAVSDAIAVAPGETIHGSAWVRVKDVPEKTGAVIMIAAFSDLTGGNESVQKFNTAPIAEASKGWVKIEGSVKVPELAANLRVRLGFSYAKGTCWWDDVKITADSPLAVRIDRDDARLSPAVEALPVAILNREGRKGTARVRVTLNKQSAEERVELSGEGVQRVEVPVKLPPPGKVTAKAELLLGEKSVFAEERKAFVPPPVVLGVPSPTHWAVEDGEPVIEGRVDLAVPQAMLGGKVVVHLEDEAEKAIAKY